MGPAYGLKSEKATLRRTLLAVPVYVIMARTVARMHVLIFQSNNHRVNFKLCVWSFDVVYAVVINIALGRSYLVAGS